MGIRNVWKKLREIPDRLGRMCPPGYDYKPQLQSNGALFGMGFGLNLHFFMVLQDAYDSLFVYYRNLDLGQVKATLQLRPDAIAHSFTDLVSAYWWWYLPWVIGLAVNIVLHYTYYYRGTKSIYVMRRLRRPCVVLKSCVKAPALQLVAGLVVALLWYFVCFGIYLLVMPGECNPRFL